MLFIWEIWDHLGDGLNPPAVKTASVMPASIRHNLFSTERQQPLDK